VAKGAGSGAAAREADFPSTANGSGRASITTKETKNEKLLGDLRGLGGADSARSHTTIR
jgi:hypothetical protein